MAKFFEFMDILKAQGFDMVSRTKLIRHQDTRYDLQALHRSEWLETYQAIQNQPVFDRCEWIISLLATEKTYAKFIGIYSVEEKLPGSKAKLPAGFPYPEMGKCKFYYNLKKLSGFEEFEERIIIDWGKSTRSWHQYAKNPKRVVEILPAGAGGSKPIPVFRDYMDFNLSHAELIRVFADPIGHREWMARLSAVAGIYLILDTKKGRQYVGSAYGEDGIWGRWKNYARTGHGGNTLLKELVQSEKYYPSAFQYTLLQVLPKSLTKNEISAWEKRYKDKLGSKVSGLNLN
jgi:hypothetical protein